MPGWAGQIATLLGADTESGRETERLPHHIAREARHVSKWRIFMREGGRSQP